MPEWLTEPILLSIIGGVFALLTAIVTKLSFDMSRTRKDTAAVHQSINNRPTSLSDRLDEVIDALKRVEAKQKGDGQKLDTHTKDLRGIDDSIGILRSADRDLQKGLAYTQREFTQHVNETGPMRDKINRLADKFLKD
ncbi:hypothetical protein [Glutamicibacter sp. NPDC090743]|uniref:hypothetical protein n=1 Tax=Glutamicibacter sp. NPDC090743 TaxID=3364001 RepID=UPI00381B214E